MAKSAFNKRSSKVTKRRLHGGVSKKGGAQADRWRFYVMWGLTALVFGILFVRAFWLQLYNQDFYSAKAQSYIHRERVEPAMRGVIYDRNQVPLALSTPVNTVIFNARQFHEGQELYTKKRLSKIEAAKAKADPELLKEALETPETPQRYNIQALSSELGVSEDKILSAFDSTYDNGTPKSQYKILKREVPPHLANKIDNSYAGVTLETEYRRFYPQPQPVAQLIGYMGRTTTDNHVDFTGRAGLELMHNTSLSGKNGLVETTWGARGIGTVDTRMIEPTVAGADLNLSIDSRIQYLLYRELERAGRLQNAMSASGVVVDAQTGEVLAMANWPSFNSNDMSTRTADRERNRVVTDTFEPGSVVKPITVSAALEAGIYKPWSSVHIGGSTLALPGKTYREEHYYGPDVSLEDLIAKSSNLASIKIGLALPLDGISSMQRSFGLGAGKVLDFPGEQSGVLTDPTERQILKRANLTFGYGLNVSLVQLAQAYSVIAADGVKHPLTLIKGGNAGQSTRVISEENAKAVRHMMEAVVTRGSGKRAKIEGYRVAGKTGTARRYDEGGYKQGSYRGLFVGMAPASHPRFVTAIKVEDPKNGQFYGGLVAAPVFAQVTKEALRLYSVKPDDSVSWAQLTAQDARP